MLKVKDLTIAYGSRTVLNNLNLELTTRGVYGLAAPNGTGKTTLLRCIGGVNPKAFKHVTVSLGNHSDLVANPTQKKLFHQCIFYYESEGMLFPSLTVRDHLNFISGVYQNSQDVQAILDELDMNHFAHMKVRELSLGMRQLCILAMALTSNAPFLVLDEPTNGLDPFNTQIILDVIKRYAQKDKTVLYSTHNLEHLQQTADYVLMFQDGALVWVDPQKEQVADAFERLYRYDGAANYLQSSRASAQTSPGTR